MKIAFLIGVNDVGGAEYVSYQHVKMAFWSGLEVVVLSGTGGMFHNRIEEEGIPIEIVGMNPNIRKVEQLITGCDVVFNCNFFGITGLVTSLKNKLGFRYLTIIHSNIDWVYDQLVKYDADTDGYYAIHQKITDSFAGKGVMGHEKFTVIPNCIDLMKIDEDLSYDGNLIKKCIGIKDNEFVIGMVTRVSADKNILDAVKIVSMLPKRMNARLLIIGGAADNDASESYCNRVNELADTVKTKVLITGNLFLEGVYRCIRAFDIGLNCSPSEGLPIALLEMMGAGITCVMPGFGEIPEVLEGRGIVVPIRQRMGIREILRGCYTDEEIGLYVKAITDIYDDLPKRKRLGNAARKYVFKNRSIEKQEKQFLKFIAMAKKKKEVQNIVPEPEAAVQETAIQETAIPEAAPELPVVSVLMPIRDGNPEWIKEAVESIFAQDYKGDMELVIVNHDCRGSLNKKISDIVTAGKNKNTLIRAFSLMIDDETLEFSEVLDKGVAVCKGSVIVRMDCDDIAAPNLVSKLVGHLVENPDMAVCGTQLKFFGSKEFTTNHPAKVDRAAAMNLPGYWFVNHPGVAIRKSELEKVGGYGKTKTGYAEDYHLWCKILKGGGVIANLPGAFMKYRCYAKTWRYQPGHEAFLAKEKAGLK